jgi:gliding motility-associated-like protein
MIKYTLTLLITLVCFAANSQITVSVTGANKFVECGIADTLVIKITNNSLVTAKNINVGIPFQANMEYVDSVANVVETNITNLNNPILGLQSDSILPGQSDSIIIFAKALCGYVTGGPTFVRANVFTSVGNGFDIYNGFSAISPNISLTENVLSGSFARPRVDTIVKEWQVQQIQGAGYVTKLYLQNDYIDMQLLDIQYDSMGVLTTLPLTNYTNIAGKLYITLDSSIAPFYGNNDSVFELGETITIRTYFTTLNCDFSSEIIGGYSCNNITDKVSFCQSSSAVISSVTPVIQNYDDISWDIYRDTITPIANCQDQIVRMVFKNTSLETAIGTANFYDLVIILPVPNIRNQQIEVRQLIIDGYVIDSVEYENSLLNVISGFGVGSVFLDSFLFAPIPGSLLQDLDGDGAYDDLEIGDSIVFEYIIKKHPGRFLPSGTDNTNPVSFSVGCHDKVSATITNRISASGFTLSSREGLLSTVFNNVTLPILNIGDTNSVYYNGMAFVGTTSTNCGDSVAIKFRIKLPQGINIINTSKLRIQANSSYGFPASGFTNALVSQVDSIGWDVTFKHPNNYKNGEALSVYYNYEVYFDLAPTCDFFTKNGLCNSLSGAKMDIEYALYLCNPICGGAETDTISDAHLHSPRFTMQVLDPLNLCVLPSTNSVITNDFSVYRKHFGYKSTAINLQDSSNVTSGDTVFWDLKGIVSGGNYDSIKVKIYIPNSMSDIQSTFRWDFSKLTLFDQSSSSYITCSNLDTIHLYNQGINSDSNFILFNFSVSCFGIPSFNAGDSLSFVAYGIVPTGRTSDGGAFASNLITKAEFIAYNGIVETACNAKIFNIYKYTPTTYSTHTYSGRVIPSSSCDDDPYRLRMAIRLLYSSSNHFGDYRPSLATDSLVIQLNDERNFIPGKDVLLTDYKGVDRVLPPSTYTLTNKKIVFRNIGDTTLQDFGASILFNLDVPIDIYCLNELGIYYGGDGGNPADFSFYGDIYSYSDKYKKDTALVSSNFLGYENGRSERIEYVVSPVVNNITVSGNNKFIFDVTNTSHDNSNNPTAGSKKAYITINDTAGFLTSLIAQDTNLNNTYSIRTIPGIGHVIELDSLGINETLTLSLQFLYNQCENESFIFTPAFACGDYPQDSSDYVGCDNSLSETFIVNTQNTNISISLESQPIGNPDICDTLLYDLLITNPSIGYADSLSFIYFSPDPFNINVLNATADFKGKTYTVTPILTPPNRFTFDLKNTVLDSIASLSFSPGDSLLFHVSLEPLCGTYSGLYHNFTLGGKQACGDSLQVSAVLAANQMNFNGIPPVYNAEIKLLDSAAINSCSSSQYTVAWYNLGGAPGFNSTNLNDSIWFILPPNVSYIPGSFVGGINTPANSIPTISNRARGTFISWGLNAGILPNDSVVFSINLAANSTDTCNSNYFIEYESVRLFTTSCNSASCNTPVLTSSNATNLVNNKSVLNLISLGGEINGCTDSITVNFDIENTGIPIANGTPTIISFYADSNNNGVFDNTDILLSNRTTTDSILTNDSLNVSHTFYPTGYNTDICNIIAVLDTSSCVCTESSIAIPLVINYNMNNSSVCEGDSIDISVCIGTGYYTSRTYDWEGATSYLSDSTILSPVFRAPSNITNDTTFTFVLHTDRDSCVNTDTVRVTVLAAPTSLSLNDTMICIGDSATLSNVTGASFQVWDALTGGNIMDTTTFKVAPTTTTNYFLVTIDSNSTCKSLTRTITTVFIDTINPTVICNDTTIYLDITGSFSIDTSFIFSSANENCGVDSIWTNDTLFNCANIGTNSATIYITDVNGNIDSCTANVIVIDTISPTVICNDTTIYLDATGSFTLDTSFIFSSANDNCTVDSIWTNNTLFNCSDLGINSVSMYVTDVNGNIDSCIAIVTVVDTIKPSITCVNTNILLDINGNATISLSDVSNGNSDNCAIDTTYISGDTTFDCTSIGTNTIYVVVRDVNGNIDSCSSIVTVMDNTTPNITCPPNQLDTLTNSCEYIVPDYTNLIVLLSDNCTDSSSVLITQTPVQGTTINARTSPITTIYLTANDTNSNNIQCNFDLELFCIEEIKIPEFISPNGDGINDTWIIDNIQSYPNNSVKIFNRYGVIVYEAQNYNNTWGGESEKSFRINDKTTSTLPSGTYFFILDLGEKTKNYTGYIQIQK